MTKYDSKKRQNFYILLYVQQAKSISVPLVLLITVPAPFIIKLQE